MNKRKTGDFFCFFSIFVFALSLLFLSGCGGGGSSTTTPAATTGTISGTVAVPAGSSAKAAAITKAGLTVTAAGITTTTDADGKYSLAVAAGSNIDVVVTAPSGNIVLEAIVSSVTAGSTTSQDINSTSTAVALIYNRNKTLSLATIQTSSAVASVKTAIETALTTAPDDSVAATTSITANTAVTTAVTTAAAAIADTTALTVSSVSASVVSSSTVTITWTTSKASTSQVKYGTSSSSLSSSTTEDTTLTTSHSVSINSGLSASTAYFYQVVSKDGSGTTATSTTASFTMLASGQTDTTAPTITSISVNASSISSVVTWTTNEGATTQVKYGTTSNLGSNTTEDTTLSTSHSVTVSGLTASTTYYYQVVSKDAASNSSSSSTATFTTTAAGAADTTAPTLTNVSVSVTSSAATITWNTDESSTSQVEYGTSLLLGTSTTEDTNKVTSHSVQITGLSAGTKYYFAAKSKDASANAGTSSSSFTTLTASGAAAAPTISSVTTADVKDTSAKITWQTDTASTSQVKYGTSSSNLDKSTTEDTTLTTSHTVSLTGLTAGQRYSYQVISKDSAGSSSNAGPLEFTTLASGETMDTTAPTLSTLKPANGSKVSGSTLLEAEGSDNVGYAKCVFYIDGAVFATATASGNGCFTLWNTTTATNGSSHTIKATVSDAAGNSATSSTNTVTVDNSNTGTVTGAVSFSGSGGPGSSLVYAQSNDPTKAGSGGPDGPITTADSSGNYTLTVPAGTWYIAAVKDVNGDGDIQDGDAFACTPVQVTVASGETKTGNNLTLTTSSCGAKALPANVLKKIKGMSKKK